MSAVYSPDRARSYGSLTATDAAPAEQGLDKRRQTTADGHSPRPRQPQAPTTVQPAPPAAASPIPLALANPPSRPGAPRSRARTQAPPHPAPRTLRTAPARLLPGRAPRFPKPGGSSRSQPRRPPAPPPKSRASRRHQALQRLELSHPADESRR